MIILKFLSLVNSDMHDFHPIEGNKINSISITNDKISPSNAPHETQRTFWNNIEKQVKCEN